MKFRHGLAIAGIATAGVGGIWTLAQVEARHPGSLKESTDDFWETFDEQQEGVAGAGVSTGENVGGVLTEAADVIDDNMPAPPEETE